ncbi:S-adenosyl-L-methionine-dependent methyltransferase [Lasiosphaeria hispida]|uniref:S-adenosyl-L-methionine-dependent methyltransferase n=1 Tax=Lasiosphaeria hispida TaxID=260671 RepID=A0AAJ0HP45_9PEZI|nr:S-adenosyl-L-methionine-dependent methyltransferase [Lasiosphaeria hispida]
MSYSQAGSTTPLRGPAPLEADDSLDSDVDSAIECDLLSDSASIASSILQYRHENGRTYHAYKDGKYILPNDIPEQDRLDLQHHLFLLTFDNQLYLSPAGRDGHALHNVLDAGTGTGIWANDLADEFPSAAIFGVDLSPIQSPFVPPNVRFQIDDLEEPWTFTTKFDFIYSRMMTAALADWPRFFQQAYDSLAPGGWVELADIYSLQCDDGSLKKDSALRKWVDLLLEGARLLGRPFDGADKYREQLVAQGFTNVHEVIFKWPQNKWPKDRKYKEIGVWTLENVGSAMEALSSAVYTRALGWSKEDMDTLIAQARAEMRDTSIHAYWPIYVVYGQKPK